MSIFANFDFDSDDNEPESDVIAHTPSALKSEFDNAQPVVVAPQSNKEEILSPVLEPSTLETSSSSMDNVGAKKNKKVVVGKTSEKSRVKKSVKDGKVSPVKKTIAKKPKTSPAAAVSSSKGGRGQNRSTENSSQKTPPPPSVSSPLAQSSLQGVSIVNSNSADPVKQAKLELLYRLFSSF